MKIETIYAYIWDHATREAALTYATLAKLDPRDVMRVTWSALGEYHRVPLRGAIKGLLEATDLARAKMDEDAERLKAINT